MPDVAENVAAGVQNATPLTGNQSATKHGLDALRGHPMGLCLNRLPRGAGHITRRVRAFRQCLERALAERNGHGDTGKAILRAALVQTCCKWQVVSELAARWLYLRADAMSDGDRLNYVRMVAWASERRDAALKALGLDRTEAQSIAALLYGPKFGGGDV